MRISDWSSDVCSSDLRGRDGNARRFHGLPGIRCGSGRNSKAPTRCWISRRDLCRTLVSRVAVLYACTEDRRRYRGWLLDHRWGECLDPFDPSDALAGPMVEGAARSEAHTSALQS